MCTFLQPTIAIRYAFIEPAIWSVEPIDDLHCHGNQFDAKANQIEDGAWACIAVATKDHAGNFSVSAPLRVYVDYDYNGQPAHVRRQPAGRRPSRPVRAPASSTRLRTRCRPGRAPRAGSPGT